MTAGRLETALLARHKRPRTRRVYALWENLGDLCTELNLTPATALRCMERDMPLPAEFDDRVVSIARARRQPLEAHEIRRMRVQATMAEDLVRRRADMDRVMDDCGGPGDFAAALGEARSATRTWRARGRFPPSKKFEIIEHCRACGIEVDLKLFDPL